MDKVKAFIVKHKVIVAVICVALICVMAIGGHLYDQHQKQLKFEREHPLVGKVYKFYYKEKPADGNWQTTTGYYVFGNNNYRNKVVTVYSDEGGIGKVRKMLNNKQTYKREFRNKVTSNYRVIDGNKLVVGGNKLTDTYYQVKKGKNWVGMYDADEGNEEVSGEVHKISPVHVK